MQNNNIEKKIAVLVGPTSSGKTSSAINLCNTFGGSIISADSRQAYRYMDIGTGKKPLNVSKIIKEDYCWKIEDVDIWGYDLINPGEYLSAYDFSEFAKNKIFDLHQVNQNIILAGGTGFYIDTITGRIALDASEPNTELRKELDKLSPEELLEKLYEFNPAATEKIDRNNKVRLIRAIEKELNTSKKEDTNPSPLRYTPIEYLYIGLTAPREILFSRTDQWLDEIWEKGLIDEVKDLIDKGYKDTPQMNGLIYKTTKDYIQGDISEDNAKQRIKYDLHAYVRRQQTWFKKNPQIFWLDITEKTFSQNLTDVVKSKLGWTKI